MEVRDLGQGLQLLSACNDVDRHTDTQTLKLTVKIDSQVHK